MKREITKMINEKILPKTSCNSIRDTQHIPKLKLLAIAVHHSIKDMLIPPTGGVLSTRSKPVGHHFHMTHETWHAWLLNSFLKAHETKHPAKKF